MSAHRVVFESYAGVDVVLPNGTTVRCQALPLEEAITFIELLERARDNDLKALKRFLREFPKAVGAGTAFADLTPGELIDVALGFFVARRTPTPTTGAAGPAMTPTNGSGSTK